MWWNAIYDAAEAARDRGAINLGGSAYSDMHINAGHRAVQESERALWDAVALMGGTVRVGPDTIIQTREVRFTGETPPRFARWVTITRFHFLYDLDLEPVESVAT